jgi:hypothetical protein
MKRLSHKKQVLGVGRVRTLAVHGALIIAVIASESSGQSRSDSLERPGGQRVSGHLTGDARSGFGFMPASAAAPLALETGSIVYFNSSGPETFASPPPVRVFASESLRLSGWLRGISPKSVSLRPMWAGQDVTLPRPGVQAVVQRPGEARVLVDGFETLDTGRWAITGKPETVAEPHLNDKHSLRLPAGATSLVHRLAETIATGRLDVGFRDDGAVVAGQQWSIELTFHGASGFSPMRVWLGWSEESLAVESPNGPALAVQRLARTPGWHRLSLKFSPDDTEISVDGKDLAHGKGPDGLLISIRLASSMSAQATPPNGLAGHIDDLQLIRFAEPPASLELDTKHDEARLVVGDQLFGDIKQSDSEHVSMVVDGEPVSLNWSDLSGLYFRRSPAQGAIVEGVLARLEWRSAAGDEDDNFDFAEGAITAISDRAVTVATPYSGELSVPREFLRKLVVQGQGSRVVIDAAAHHLGDEFSATAPVLDPPEPEGALLERTITLAQIPTRRSYLVLDVVQVVGENNDPRWSPRVRDGELRTYIVINGKRVDYLNRYIKTRNDTPERVAIPIPAGSFQPGENTIRLELTGTATESKELDDFGVLQMALEFRSTPDRVPEAPHDLGPP